jgi:hypothetical protein
MAEAQTQALVGHAEAPEHAEPSFLGLDPGGWVALAVLFVFVIMLWQ